MTVNDILTFDTYNRDFDDLDFKYLNNIKIVDDSVNYKGKLLPYFNDNYLYFDILYPNGTIDKLFSSSINEKKEIISILFHELYHYKEAITTSKYMDYHKLLFGTYNSTYKLTLAIGYRQWAEYYAYYNSSKYYLRKIDFTNVLSGSWASLQAIHNKLLSEGELQILQTVFESVNTFIGFSIIFIAQSNRLNNKSYIKQISEYKNHEFYSIHYDYILDLMQYMNNLYKTYPFWISEAAFVEIGKYILNIFNRYNITFSTDDLSDNFIFKLAK